MHGIIVDVTVDPNRGEEATWMVHEMIVPKARAHAGFVAGCWLSAEQGNLLRTVHLYDSQDAAQASPAAAIQTEGSAARCARHPRVRRNV